MAFLLEASSKHLTCRKLKATVAVCRLHGEGRITDSRKRVSVAEKRGLKAHMFWEAYQRLVEYGPVDATLRHAAAAGLWRQAHMIAPFSFPDFAKGYERAMTADPTFLPARPNAFLRALDRVASPKLTERLINPVRKIRLGVADAPPRAEVDAS